MAEFQEVMQQFNRMCKANAGCIDCPLRSQDGDMCSVGAFINNPGYIEQQVMTWAAEHPEPVYPMWWEVLIDLEVIGGMLGDMKMGEYIIHRLMHTPISADIARKLGYEPKEG